METNLENTKALVCTTGYICGKWSDVAYTTRATGEGETFRERKRSRVSCAEYGVTVAALYLKGNTERKHGRSVPQTREVDI